MYIEVNGVSLYCETKGDSANPPIYFLHGAPGLSDCRSDIATFSSLSDEYFLVFMDHRGSGRSGEVPPYTHEQWTSDIDALRQHFGHEKISVLGGSYGGFLALEYVLRYQEHVAHVMLRDTSPSGLDDEVSISLALNSGLGIEEEPLRRLFNGQVYSDEELRRVYGSIIPLYTTVKPTPEQVEQRLDSIYFHYQTHNYAFSINKPKYNIIPRLKEIKVPTLITVGRHDWITPINNSVLLSREIENSTLVVFEDCGHSPQLEAKDKFLKLVRDFLKKN